MILVLSSLTIAMLMVIWFKTDALIEYTRLLRLHSFEPLASFCLIKKEVPSLSFIDFLSEHYNCFFTRLLICPICVATWLGLISTFFIPFSYGLPSAFLGLFLYLLLGKLLTNA